MLCVILFILLLCENCYLLPPLCQGHAELYLQNGHFVQVTKSKDGPVYMEMQACTNTSAVEPPEISDLVFQNVWMLWLWAVEWPFHYSMPQLQRVQINDVKSIGSWGNCSNLKHVYVKRGLNLPNFAKIPSGWLSNCTQLQSLDLRNMTIAEIRAILDSAPTVKELKLYNIIDMPYIIHLPIMTSKYEYLTNVNIVTYFSNYLADNTTWGDVSEALVQQLALLPRLESLEIMEKTFDLCAMSHQQQVKFASLQSLKLMNTKTTRLCMKKNFVTPRLSHISIWASPGLKIQFGELYSEPAPHLVMDLYSFGQVVSFIFTKNDYLALSTETDDGRKGNVTLKGIKQALECECNSNAFWFSRALRAGLITAPGITCSDESSLMDLPCAWLECERVRCNSSCVCCREDQDAIRGDCRETNLNTIPSEILQLPNLTQLIASNNDIWTLPNQLPQTLMYVDLSGNKIWQGGATRVSALFDQPTRRLRLAQNFILCSCENKHLINVLQNHSSQIEDFENITCAITNMKVGDVDISNLCASQDREAALLKQRETMIITVITVLVCIAAVLILTMVMYHRRRNIQIFLFARGWCLYCVKEEDLDADKRYDIFLSFCHDDTELVFEKLLPTLDSGYSVCLHLRDWCPGEMISTQIAMSVEQSRRTIVVLSRSFVRSLWGRLEFQTAHIIGLTEGRVRVVMIVIDDVLEKDELSPELRSYVNLNTYVRLDDPWFWDKLRFALPHQPSPHAPQIPNPVLRVDPRHCIAMNGIGNNSFTTL